MSTSWTLVTGGAKRLGAEICRTLSKEGHNVLVHYNTSKEQALEVAKSCGSRSEVIQGDFSTRKGVERFVEEYKTRFDNPTNLINNVGNYLVNSLSGTSVDQWYALMQTNLHAPFILSKELAPTGSILNIGIAGVSRSYVSTYNPVFTLTKQALWALTLAMAKELAANGVRVNMVSPGYLENSVDIATIPLGRPSTLEEIARLIAFLLADESSTITGQNIEVAGATRLS